MAVLTENPFHDLYEYLTDSGVVIPQTSTVKSMVVNAYNAVFGTSISTDDETPIGRFVEGFTMLIVNVLGVNAKNANMLNPRLATGMALDRIGASFGVVRGVDMGDEEYRNLIAKGQSNGIGFPESIVKSILAVDGVSSVIVLNNGSDDPANEPQNATYSIQVPPHSVFISVRGGADSDIANAIAKTISLGCGMANYDSYTGSEVSVVVADGRTITFYRPDNELDDVSFAVDIVPDGYSGDDIETDVEAVVRQFVRINNRPGAITPKELEDFVNASGIGVACKSAKIFKNLVPTSAVVIRPSDYIDSTSITVSVNVL